MYLFSSPSAPLAAVRPRTRLDLEGMGERLTPAAPVITSFDTNCLYGNVWTISGTVTDDQSVDGLAVSLSGPGAIDGIKAIVDSSGFFSIEVEVIQSGEVVAIVEDFDFNVSDPAIAVVST